LAYEPFRYVSFCPGAGRPITRRQRVRQARLGIRDLALQIKPHICRRFFEQMTGRSSGTCSIRALPNVGVVRAQGQDLTQHSDAVVNKMNLAAFMVIPAHRNFPES
jgi:hypothetical protein